LTIATPDLRVRATLHEATARMQHGGSAIVMSALPRAAPFPEVASGVPTPA